MAHAQDVPTTKPAPKAGSKPPASQPATALPPRFVPPEVREKLNKAVTQIVNEARDLDVLEEPKNKPVLSRPHPLVKDWGPDMIPALLSVFAGRLTGNDFRDAYVRWHLLWVLQKTPNEQRVEVARQMVKVLEDMPGRLKVDHVSTGEYDNPTIRNEYENIIHNELRVTTGYPPYQKYVYAPDSIALMPAESRARAQQLWAHAQAIKGQFKFIPNPKGIAFNNRIDAINELVRQYQGEMVYELARSGDFHLEEAIIKQLDKHARQGTLTAFDMMNYFYQACFDGYLKKLSRAELADLAVALESTARSTESIWISHGGYPRNFAHYTFHMIESFKLGDTMSVVSEGKSEGK